jgi:hypothetical protein
MPRMLDSVYGDNPSPGLEREVDTRLHATASLESGLPRCAAGGELGLRLGGSTKRC